LFDAKTVADDGIVMVIGAS